MKRNTRSCERPHQMRKLLSPAKSNPARAFPTTPSLTQTMTFTGYVLSTERDAERRAVSDAENETETWSARSLQQGIVISLALFHLLQCLREMLCHLFH